ncbi:MAG: hypothetical protein HYS53_00605 [Candidatus Aenigmarchaeota archaeon]|nr:hypothetical protein [Candidatus Aenigmarchaeota archaeon]
MGITDEMRKARGVMPPVDTTTETTPTGQAARRSGLYDLFNGEDALGFEFEGVKYRLAAVGHSGAATNNFVLATHPVPMHLDITKYDGGVGQGSVTVRAYDVGILFFTNKLNEEQQYTAKRTLASAVLGFRDGLEKQLFYDDGSLRVRLQSNIDFYAQELHQGIKDNPVIKALKNYTEGADLRVYVSEIKGGQ